MGRGRKGREKTIPGHEGVGGQKVWVGTLHKGKRVTKISHL